ncbi:hypothetical protein LA080_009320 [Diaporthe eres]|nr:hypothetical protein LA080_009320 [Diaporthe eres]
METCAWSGLAGRREPVVEMWRGHWGHSQQPHQETHSGRPAEAVGGLDGQVAGSKGFRDFAPPPRWGHDDVVFAARPVGSEATRAWGMG